MLSQSSPLPAPPFAAFVLFDDVAPEILAREDADSGAWQGYLAKLLLPTHPAPSRSC